MITMQQLDRTNLGGHTRQHMQKNLSQNEDKYVKNLWALGLDEDRQPLSYTTPGESLTRLRQDLAQQYHRVCSSLGAMEGSFPAVEAGGGRIMWPSSSSTSALTDHTLHGGQQHKPLLGAPGMLGGASSRLPMELEQPLAALHAVQQQPGSQLKEAVHELLRGSHLGLGRRGAGGLRALPHYPKPPPLLLTQGEGSEVQPFLHHEGGVLQGESSWIYPLARHSRARAAVSAPHLPYSRSQLPARADRMPSIDTLSNFVHTKASRQYKGPTSLNHLGLDSGDELDKLLKDYVKQRERV